MTQLTRVRMANGESEYDVSLTMFLDPDIPGAARFRVQVDESTFEYKTLGPAMTKFNSEVGQLVLAGAAVVGVYKQDEAQEGAEDE